MRSIFVTAAAFLSLSTPALADWSGPYGGVALGYADSTVQDISFGPGPFDVDGLEFGLFGGYNMQAGSIVYGAEVSVFASNASGSDGAFQTPFEANSALSLLARVGYDAGAFLPWAAVGVQLATSNSTHGPGGGTEVLGSDWSGTVIAVGVDYAINDMIFVRGAYETVDYGTLAQGFGGGGDIHNTSYETDRITIGVGYNF